MTGSAQPRPAISAVIPVYNEIEILEAVIQDLVKSLDEVLPDHEIIISENGSTDGTAALADELAARFSAVRVLHSPVADYGLALQRGLLEARGDVLVNFSADLVRID